MNAKNIIYTTLMAVIIMLSFLACSGSGLDEDTNIITPPTVQRLIKYEGCDDFIEDAKLVLLMRAESLVDSYSECYSVDYHENGDVATTSADAAGVSDSSSTESSGAVEFTDTNVQEDAVDESDMMKTDGEYIYIANNEGIDVFKAWPMDEFAKVTTYEMDEGPNTLYLYQDRLIAIASFYDSTDYSSKTRITVLNIEDPSVPTVEKIREVVGSSVDSKLVDGTLHMALSTSISYDYEYPDIDYNDACDGGAKVEQAKEEAKQANATAIAALTIDDVLPFFSNEDSSVSLDCGSLYSDGTDDETSLTALFSMKVSDDSSDQFSLIRGRTQEVYATTESVYFAASNYSTEGTYIHRFTIGNSSSLHTYFGSGAVIGHINDTFSLSEYEGDFRIATTVGWVSNSGSSTSYNNVFVLDASDTEMPVIGSIEDIAPGEQIYAARFIADKGYIVTFQKVDPLFVIDLADSTNPTIQGELKMPGYSTYLHQLDENHIIGLGKDAEEDSSGNFAWYQGIKLALFDVEDGYNPSIVDDLIVGSRGTDSEALNDHHAFTFERSTGLLALPIQLYEGSEGGNDYGTFSYNGVHVYSIATDGIEILAEIELPDDSSEPQRTLMISDDTESGMYVLDYQTLYLIDMDSYTVVDEEDVSDFCGYCGVYYFI